MVMQHNNSAQSMSGGRMGMEACAKGMVILL
jgi:hypothetical protein